MDDLFDEDIFKAINLINCVKLRTSFGGPAPEVVRKHIELIKEKLSNM